MAEVGAARFDHVLATRLHRDDDVEADLELATADDVVWVPAPRADELIASEVAS